MANRSPRPGVTFALVAAKADELFDQGIRPTVTKIREAIGSGSPNTIHKHLATWREDHPEVMVEVNSLPEQLANAIIAEIARIASKSKEEAEYSLTQIQNENSVLASTGEALEQERDGLQEQLLELTAQYNNLLGKSEEQAVEFTRINSDLERERQETDHLHVENTQQKSQISSLSERLAEKTATFDLLAKAHKADQEHLNAEVQAKAAAEKNLAVLEALLVATKEQLETHKVREVKLEGEVEKERQATDMARAEVKELLAGSEGQTAKIAELTQAIVGQKAQLSALEKQLCAAENEITDLRTKLITGKYPED